MRLRPCRWLGASLLSGCPGNPVEGSGLDGGSTTAASSPSTAEGPEPETASGLTLGAEGSTTSAPTGTASGNGDASDGSTLDTAAETTADAGVTTADDDGTSSTGVETCADDQEPNDGEDAPFLLDPIGCGSSRMLDGVADGRTTPDWFQYYGDYDIVACGVEVDDFALPRVRLDSGPAMVVCAYVTCETEADIVCLAGAPSRSPGGLQGCCGDGDAHLQVDCTPIDESTDVLVSVDTTDVACAPYTLELAF